MSREAMQLVLEALGEIEWSNDSQWQSDRAKVAIAVLRQALETEKQEPVAFINVEKQKLEWAKLTSWHTPTIVNLPKIPLYTAPQKRDLTCVCGAVWEGETMVHPPRKREWVGLPESACAAMTLAQVSAMKYAELVLKEKNT